MKKENAVTNLSASKGKTGKTQVQKRNATGESSLSSAAIDGQRIISYQSHNNQEQYYELFNLVSSGVAVYKAVDKGKDFIFTDFNKAAEKIEGTPREKVIGRRVTEVFPGIREMTLLSTFQKVWKTGKPEFHPAAVYKNKHLVSWRENYVHKLPSGEIMAIYEDITERKQIEVDLRDNEKRYRGLFEDSPVSLYVEDFSAVKQRLDALQAEGVKDMRTYLESHPEEVSDCAALTKIVDVNKAGISLFKAKKKDDLLKNLSEILSPQSFKKFRQELIYLHEGKTKFSWEGKSLTMDSELIDTNLSWSVVPGYEKDLSKVLVSIEDITERKRIKETLQENEERFRGLFENSPVSLWEEDFSAVKQRLDALRAEGVTDMHAYLKSHPEEVANCAALIKVLDVNKASIELYRARDKEHLIKNLAQIVSIGYTGKFIDELVNIGEGLPRFNFETVNQAIDGERIEISISWAAAPGHESDLSRVLISIVDITERKRAEAEMSRLVAELRDLSETEKKNRIFAEALAKNVSVINSSLKAEDVMDSIIDSIGEIVPYDAAAVMMVKGQQARIVRSKGYRERGLEKWVEQTQFDLNKIKDFNTIVRSKKFKVTPNTEQSQEWTVVAETAWVKSHITSPIIEGSRVIGFLNLDSTTPDFYTEEHAKVLMSFSEQVSMALKNARLFAELRDLSETEKKNRVFAEALAKNATALNSSLKAEEVLDTIIDSIEEIVPFDVVSVMMIEGRQAAVLRSRGFEEKGLAKYIQDNKFDFHKYPTFQKVVNSGTFLLIPDTSKDPIWIQDGKNNWRILSNVQVPIKEGKTVVGFLNLGNGIPGFYNEEHANRLMSFSEQVSIALKNARLFEDTQRRMNRMQAMTQIDLAINSSLDINVSLEIVLIQAKDQLKADAVDILLVNKATGSLVFSKAKGFKTDEIRKSNFRLGTGLPGKAVLDRTLIAIPDLNLTSGSYFKNLLVEREGFVSYYCAPLITKGEVKGVMEIYFRQPFQADQEWQEFLEMLAQQTAIAINNAELLNSLKVSNADLINAYETTLMGWVDALDMRDHETEGHTQRVSEQSLQLARRMGIKDSEIVNFERGALLHDIGKVAVSDMILNKPGPLTEEEWVIMRQHPVFAFQLLSKSKYLIPALDIPYCHHEKWDGSGYPRGLKGEAIPLAARIFAVVDVWDALISDRPYRKAWTKKKTLEYIQEQSGKHFDPKVVSAFQSLTKPEYK